MIIRMARLQQRYDHRLRDLVQGTGDVTIATDLGIARSAARGWLGKAPKVVVSLPTLSNAPRARQDTPEAHAVDPAGSGRIVARPEVGGLHHRYERHAA